jgi:hypothetical protein
MSVLSEKWAFIFVAVLLSSCSSDNKPNGPTVNIPSIAVGNGMADDTAAIQKAINGAVPGTVINFGDRSKTYAVSATITFPSDLSYWGNSATIKLIAPSSTGSSSPLISLPSGNADNITIHGLAFDAGGYAGVMHIATIGSGKTPPRNVNITHCTFKNSKHGNTVAPNIGSGIFNTVGLADSTISNNTFSNVGLGLSIVNPSDLTVSGNSFQSIEAGDAMSFQVWQQFSGLVISNNIGQNLYRMAIEIQTMQATGSNGQPVTLDNVTIQGNNFQNWVRGGTYGFGFELKFISPTSCNVSNNKLLNGLTAYGIEDGSPGCRITGNTISGFVDGIAVTAPDTIIQDNTISKSLDSGIQITNVNNEINSQIIGNTITNAQKAGITIVQGDHRGSTFQGNTIIRQAGAWPDDARTTFLGIIISGGLSAPIAINRNTITQTAAAPVAGFGFYGIGVYGDVAGTVYDGNKVASTSNVPIGIGFNLSGAPLLSGDVVRNTSLINLQRVSNGYTDGNISITNNRACKVVVSDAHLITSESCGG